MAVIHSAYAFDPDAFHTNLNKHVMREGRLDEEVFRTLAREIAATPSVTIQRVFRDLRFDDDWLEASNSERDRATQWYLINLARVLTIAPSLSLRSLVSWRVWGLLLPLRGWSKTDTDTLLRGRPLHTLVQASANPIFVAEFGDIDQYGGWLSLSDVEALYSRIAGLESGLLTHSQTESLTQLAALWSQQPTDLIHQAYSDAIDMLEFARSRQAALFVILD